MAKYPDKILFSKQKLDTKSDEVIGAFLYEETLPLKSLRTKKTPMNRPSMSSFVNVCFHWIISLKFPLGKRRDTL